MKQQYPEANSSYDLTAAFLVFVVCIILSIFFHLTPYSELIVGNG